MPVGVFRGTVNDRRGVRGCCSIGEQNPFKENRGQRCGPVRARVGEDLDLELQGATPEPLPGFGLWPGGLPQSPWQLPPPRPVLLF